MDPCLVGLITAGAGFTLYKILPEVYSWLKQILGDFFYKNVIVTIAQNKPKVVNLVKFMTQFPQYQKTKCINITIDGQEYNVPIIDVKFTVSGNTDYEFSMKANTDSTGNLVNVVVSTWKRDMLSEDNKCLETFDTFVKTFPSTQPQQPSQSIQTDKPPVRLENGKVILVTPSRSTPNAYLQRSPRKLLITESTSKSTKADTNQSQPLIDLTTVTPANYYGPSKRGPLSNPRKTNQTASSSQKEVY